MNLSRGGALAVVVVALLALAVWSRVTRQSPAAPMAPERTVAHADARAAHDASVETRERFRDVAPGLRVAEIERVYEGERAHIIIARLELARVSLAIEPLSQRRFEALFDRDDIALAVNGGFFEPSFEPSGLAVSVGTVLSPERPRGGSGVLVVKDGVARLLPFPAGEEATHADLALQCGPRLVEADGTLGIRSESPDRARRSALCIRDDGRTLDVIAVRRVGGNRGPGLRTFAEWLHRGIPEGETPCAAALNLDGGPSTGIYVRGVSTARIVPYGPVVQALVVRRSSSP